MTNTPIAVTAKHSTQTCEQHNAQPETGRERTGTAAGGAIDFEAAASMAAIVERAVPSPAIFGAVLSPGGAHGDIPIPPVLQLDQPGEAREPREFRCSAGEGALSVALDSCLTADLSNIPSKSAGLRIDWSPMLLGGETATDVSPSANGDFPVDGASTEARLGGAAGSSVFCE